AVAQYLGDGLLAYFGYPSASEDDAERSVRAALAIVDAVRLRQPVPGVTLQARIGIATGLVVVGELISGSRRGQAVIGETPNLAARLQGIAEPNSVVIAAMTHRLIGGRFQCLDLGSHWLKGFSAPVPAYRVVAAGAGRSRSEVRHPGRITPF